MAHPVTLHVGPPVFKAARARAQNLSPIPIGEGTADDLIAPGMRAVRELGEGGLDR